MRILGAVGAVLCAVSIPGLMLAAAQSSVTQSSAAQPPGSQPPADVGALTATVTRLGPEIARQVGELFFAVHGAVVRQDPAELRAGCGRRRAEAQVFDPLFTSQISSLLTQPNFDAHPQLFGRIVTLTHLSLDLRVTLEGVCGPTPPNRAELLAAYAVISNAYALNRQGAGERPGTSP